MNQRMWTARIDRHDETGRCVETAELHVTGASSTAARQQARELLMAEYDSDWSITSVRRTPWVKVAG